MTLNDVVMGTVAGAIRKYLKDSNELPEKSMVGAIPVSLREAGDETANNQASMILVSLATDIKDPVARLKQINASSNASKSTMNKFKAVILDDFPMFGAPWLISGVASMFGRSGLINVIPPVANVAISNVAGAPFPMYFAGALVTCYYPVSIASHGMALNVTVQSYNGRMDYGLIACRRAVPDITEIGDYMLVEHKTLLDLAGPMPSAQPAAATGAAATAPAPKPVRAVRKPKLKIVGKSVGKSTAKSTENPVVKPVVKALVNAVSKPASKKAPKASTPAKRARVGATASS